MRKLVWLPLLLSMSAAMASPTYYTIDPSHTYPHFAIDHLGFSTLYGRFDQTTGRLMIDWERKTGFVEVKIAAVSINTGHGKRDKHLRSPDFLNVMEFPDIHYESTHVRIADDKTAVVEGKLTLLGVTRPVTLTVERIHCGVNPINKKDTCGFNAKAHIKRSDFGSRYGLPGIGDDMELWFEVEAIKDE